MVSALLILNACQEEETSAGTEDLILGTWLLDKATKNGRETESLTDLVYEFMDEGVLYTNITGAREEYKYEIEENQVIQREGSLDLDYTINSLTDSNLVISMTLRKINFHIYLNKDFEAATEE